MPVNLDLAVVSDGEWHMAQPMLLNRFDPFWIDGDDGPGVGGAVRRMNAAKLMMSEDIWFAVPVLPPVSGLVMFVESSGVALNTQPATAERSLGKPSLETPCSTL